LRNGINPIHRELFGDFDLRYYWSVHQSEWATDVMFRDPEKLAGLYPQFLRHGLTTFASPDVMRFLGRKIPPTGNLPPAFAGEVVIPFRNQSVAQASRLCRRRLKPAATKFSPLIFPSVQYSMFDVQLV